jgi:hypothetical protein
MSSEAGCLRGKGWKVGQQPKRWAADWLWAHDLGAALVIVSLRLKLLLVPLAALCHFFDVVDPACCM